MAVYREREIREFATNVAHEGIGIGGGFIVGGAVGRQVENMFFKEPVNEASTITNKFLAWLANNGSKGIVYAIAKHYGAESEFARNATKALAGSVVYDTVLRVANHGYNPAEVNLAGYRILGSDGLDAGKVQKLINENHLLRTELNKALQKLASMPANPDSAQDFKYGGAPSPAVAERQRKFAQMPTPENVLQRQRRYGAMPFEQNPEKTARQRQFGQMGTEEMGFKPDSKDTSVAKMFNMQ